MILAFGGSRFLAEEAAKDALSARGLQASDLPRLSGEELSAETLLPLLTPGLFTEAAAIVDLEGARPDKALLAALTIPGALLVVIDPASAPTRVKLYQQHGEFHAVPAPAKPAEVAQWAAQRAKETAHLKLEPDAARYLAEVFAGDLAAIAAEINKLLYLSGPYNHELLRRVVGREPPGDSFAMLDAATRGDLRAAQAQLSRLLSGGEDPFRVMGTVTWQYSLIARALALQQREGAVSEQGAAAQLGVKPYPAKKALEAARRLNEARVGEHLRHILAADIAMKHGQEPGKVLTRLLTQLCAS